MTTTPTPPRRALIAVGVAAGILLASCSTLQEPVINAPANTGLIAVGEGLYEQSCASCHGADLRGTDLGPSHLSVVYEPNHHGDIAFALAARNGVRAHHWTFGDMPPVEGLSDDDLEAIVAYVREMQRVNGFEPYPPR